MSMDLSLRSIPGKGPKANPAIPKSATSFLVTQEPGPMLLNAHSPSDTIISQRPNTRNLFLMMKCSICTCDLKHSHSRIGVSLRLYQCIVYCIQLWNGQAYPKQCYNRTRRTKPCRCKRHVCDLMWCNNNKTHYGLLNSEFSRLSKYSHSELTGWNEILCYHRNQMRDTVYSPLSRYGTLNRMESVECLNVFECVIFKVSYIAEIRSNFRGLFGNLCDMSAAIS